jgi:hypothetical protein
MFKAKDLWSLWIHLLLHGLMGQAKEGILITKDKSLKVILPSDPLKELEKMCQLYIDSGKGFVPCFPEISYSYIKVKNK